MDATASELRKELGELLRRAAEVSVELDRAEGAAVGVPHYSAIEARAHELGRELSRRIQARRMGDLAAATSAAACPTCGDRCEPRRRRRRLASIDGPLEIDEPAAHCPRCRRGFFPPPGGAGPRRP
ncbi:hypothetical protein OJF2_53420 [Aquisphaera giovannonii]|uniref:Uncharacterized protein n=1 Tax=Aquisphaera giovannonii TaxID=406548 RepID=A0A5B9W8P6_9BACT|nr:hypothetical protein [Aquisphaera giovannonii]QEH36757.1 hypothetical protein OJF2_53420 [Aquisphaera giovannonii]